MLHCQLAKLISFFGLPSFFSHCPLVFIIFCPMPKIHSLVAQTRFLWDLFSTHLPSALLSYPQGYLPTSYVLNTCHPPTSYVPTYPWVLRSILTIFMFTSAHFQVGKSTWPSFQVDNVPFPNFQVCKFTYALWSSHMHIVNFPSLHVHIAKCRSLQVYIFIMSSSHLHIVKFPSLQDDRCTLPSLQVYTCRFPRL